MSSDPKKPTAEKKHHSGNSKLIIIFLVFWIAVGVYFLLTSNLGASVKKNLAEFSVKNLSELSTLSQKKITNKKPDIVLTFQGTLRGEQGAIAIITDQMVTVGADINGVRIVEIDNRKLVIDYRGETQTLTLGETVSIRQD